MTSCIKGIGKTVISTWLVRHQEVRAAFSHIVWITFGQTPNIAKLQSLLYLQMTGVELSSEFSPDEVLQALKGALSGKCVLLVLDDCWEREHADQLMFVDDDTESKVLMSSRIRGVLEGGTTIEIKLPSEDDALQMLLTEACLDAKSTPPPPEAKAVVHFCNKLPLAIGIAGGLLKSMELANGGDWSDVLTVLKQEFAEGGQAQSMENSIIRSSLRAVKGSKQAEVIQLFKAFALVAEDTSPPLAILELMFVATGDGLDATKSKLRRAPPRLMLRSWLKILIDRSLVLGSVDRPQLHDIVRE